MRIAISGTSNVGKSTLIDGFLKRWPMYKTTQKSYRDILPPKKHSSKTSTETQWKVLNWMTDELQKTSKKDKIVFDRCPWDNLAYSFWAYGKNKGKITQAFMDKTIAVVKESLRFLDIIFWIPFNENIPVVEDGVRDTNLEYIQEVDNIFNSLHNQFLNNVEANVFYPKNDCPCIIKLEGVTLNQRLDYIGEYLDENGELYGDEHSLFNPQNLNTMEALLKHHANVAQQEQHEKALYDKFKI